MDQTATGSNWPRDIARPRVSDDNAYAESLFRTAKYRPEFPTEGFPSLDETRAWAADTTLRSID